MVECHFQADTRYEQEPGYREHMIRRGVVEIAHEIEKLGYMRFQQGPADKQEYRREHRVTVGVVAPNVTASMDAERHRAEEAFAAQVIELAINEIENWGSYYGHTSLRKDEAARFIRGALGKAKARRHL